MRIERLELNNFRGFEHLEIEFPKEEAGLAVLIGVNGSGKSSILEAIALILKEGIDNISNQINLKNFSDFDIKIGAGFFDNFLSIEFFGISREKIPQSHALHSPNRKVGVGGFKFFFNELRKKLTENKNSNIPIITFYNSNRISRSEYKKTDIKRYLVPQLKAYENALSAGFNYNDFEKWFIDRENNEYREKFSRKDFDYIDSELQQVRDAVNAFFADWKMQNIHGKEGAFNKETSVPSSLVIEKNEEVFNLFQLSDGERMVLLLVADIARRLTIANPTLENPLFGEGLVLIDEIDLHLHPGWQRKIIPNLRKTFPNIQFIVTTHSPQVLSSVKRENVFVLDNFKLAKKSYTEGRDTNSILEEVFDVPARPEEAQNEINELYALIEDPKQEKKAVKLLEKLKEKYGEDDPDLLKALLHLEFLMD